MGWIKISLKRCVKLQLAPGLPEKAQTNCKLVGGTLLNLIIDKQLSQETVDDLVYLLQDVYNGGYREEAWLVSSSEQPTVSMDNTASRYALLRRLPNRTYHVEHNYSVQTAYPFICTLDVFSRRKLLFQQSQLPKGSPRIVVHPDNEYHYVKRGTNVYLSLPCVATGNPLPQIRWLKSGVEEIRLSSNGSSSLLSGGSLLLPLEAGTDSLDVLQASYHCTAENSLGIVRSTVAVVRSAFIAAFPDKRHDVYSVNYPHTGARIVCQAPPHYPSKFQIIFFKK
ncbi:unnamed protein product [Gongylonema pulchrum]|uniref:Ig-like domain-containing protein n=1 Tax=Gongylonema pulchrum TaxID=637853 RepID=A0A183CXF6_9BILA|nr:unnamed protein product [Gongylonema pulchrum]